VLQGRDDAVGEDFVLAPEAGKRPDTSERQRPDQVGRVCDGHATAQAAHVAHVLWVEGSFFVVFSLMAVLIVAVGRVIVVTVAAVTVLMDMMMPMLHAMNNRA